MLPESEKTAQSVATGNYRLPVNTRHKKTLPLLKKLGHWVSKDKGRVFGGQYRGQQESHQPDWFRSLLASRGQWPLQRLIKRRSQTGQPVLHLILLDTSASTLQQSLFAQAKAAVEAIADKAYCRRGQITILGFGNQQVESILPRVQAPKQLRQLLNQISAGGGTPLRQGLAQAKDYIARLEKQQPELAVTTYILTDGRSTQTVRDLQLPGKSLLIDIESSPVKRGRGAEIARDIGADYFSLAWG
jgi:magnesium chelatase subunit D